MSNESPRPSAREIFAELLECAPNEREPTLLARCGDTPALCAEVRSLLAAHRSADGFLVTPAVATPAFMDDVLPAAPDREGPRCGESIGPWRLRERLGTGGMGEVFLAEREDGTFRRDVAIKLVRSELRGAAAMARFRREREFLAALDHPNVARLLDGGVTTEGRPYLVMELVRGERIDRWCDRMTATVETRLSLFLQVCAAVQHAHRNLIVHRDLKPANVLVTEEREVKLLDFGIAKLVGGERDDLSATLTMTAAPAFTPAYAAPEQLDGEAVTTATDVYALGVILYELLCGRRPHEGGDGAMPRDWERLRQAIREKDPRLPSAMVDVGAPTGTADGSDSTDPIAPTAPTASTASADPTTRATWRGLDPPRLRRRLAGDLDTIVLKALRKDPLARYATVDAFAEDIRRHLRGDPVMARPETAIHRFRRFVRRNRLAMGVTATVVVALAVGTALAVAGLLRAEDARREALRQQTHAEESAVEATRQARAARLVLDFLAEDLIGAASIDSQHAYDVPMRELLEMASRDIAVRFGDEPELHASIELMVGRLFYGLSMTESAASHIEAAHRMRTEFAEAGSDELFASLTALVELRVAQERTDEAEAMLLAIDADAAPPGRVATIENALGYLRITQGRFEEAIPHLRAAIDRASAVPEGDALIHRANLAWANHGAGRYRDAVEIYRGVLEAQQRLHGEAHFRSLRTMNNLAHALIDADDDEAAEPLLRAAIEAADASMPVDHPLRLALENNLALVLGGSGDVAGSIALLESILERQRLRFAPSAPEVLRTLNNIAMNRLTLGDHERAIGELREVHQRRTDALGEEHPSTISTLANVAYAHYLAKRHVDADPIYRAALKLRERTLGPNHPVTVSTIRFAAGNLIGGGDDAAAVVLLEEAQRRAPLAYPEDAAPRRAIDELLESARRRLAGDPAPTP